MSSKVNRYITDILTNWSLPSTAYILPTEWSPRDLLSTQLIATTDPHAWPRNFAEELKRLSSVTRGKYKGTVELLVQTAQERARIGGEYAVAQITARDVRCVVERVGLAGRAGRAGRAVEELGEVRGNETFVGGLREGLEGVEMEGDGEGRGVGVGETFEIAMR